MVLGRPVAARLAGPSRTLARHTRTRRHSRTLAISRLTRRLRAHGLRRQRSRSSKRRRRVAWPGTTGRARARRQGARARRRPRRRSRAGCWPHDSRPGARSGRLGLHGRLNDRPARRDRRQRRTGRDAAFFDAKAQLRTDDTSRRQGGGRLRRRRFRASGNLRFSVCGRDQFGVVLHGMELGLGDRGLDDGLVRDVDGVWRRLDRLWFEWLECLVDRQFGKGVGGRGGALGRVNRLGGLDQARRSERRRGGLGRLRRALRGQRRLLRRRTGGCAFGEQIATRQRDAALTGEPIDELPSHHLFDGARRAFTSMIARAAPSPGWCARAVPRPCKSELWTNDCLNDVAPRVTRRLALSRLGGCRLGLHPRPCLRLPRPLASAACAASLPESAAERSL